MVRARYVRARWWRGEVLEAEPGVNRDILIYV